jgi:hypothetical protein
MGITTSKGFKIAAALALGITVLTFGFNLLDATLSGRGGETYLSPRGVRWTTSGALIFFVFLVMALLVGLVMRIRDRRNRRIERRLARANRRDV